MAAASSGRTPSTVHVLSAAAARATLLSARASVAVVDARTPALYAMERVAGALAHPVSCERISGRTVLVYDSGSTSLDTPCSKAASAMYEMRKRVPHDTRFCMVRGGLPALRTDAPEIIVSAPLNENAVHKLRKKLHKIRSVPRWADTALDTIVQASAPAALVFPWLSLGSNQDARELKVMKERGYTHVLVVAAELKCLFPNDFTYSKVEAKDDASYSILQHFGFIVTYLRALRQRVAAGEKIHCLVHCYAGMSRSVSAVVAFLVAEGWSLDLAMSFIREKRIGASPNHGFISQLKTWQKILIEGKAAISLQSSMLHQLETPHSSKSSPPKCSSAIASTHVNMIPALKTSPVSPALVQSSICRDSCRNFTSHSTAKDCTLSSDEKALERALLSSYTAGWTDEGQETDALVPGSPCSSFDCVTDKRDADVIRNSAAARNTLSRNCQTGNLDKNAKLAMLEQCAVPCLCVSWCKHSKTWRHNRRKFTSISWASTNFEEVQIPFPKKVKLYHGLSDSASNVQSNSVLARTSLIQKEKR